MKKSRKKYASLDWDSEKTKNAMNLDSSQRIKIIHEQVTCKIFSLKALSDVETRHKKCVTAWWMTSLFPEPDSPETMKHWLSLLILREWYILFVVPNTCGLVCVREGSSLYLWDT